MNYRVRIDDEILKAKIDRHNSIWMYRAPREKPIDIKPGVYILADERGYCCYVGQTDNFKRRMADHRNRDKFCWWTHTIYFWDENSDAAFISKDDREWYEKKLKEVVEVKHPTFTKKVHRQPRNPGGGEDVLKEMLDLLKVIGFDAETPSFSTAPEIENSQSHNPVTDQHRPSGRACPEPTPHKNHKPKLGAWPNYTVLARAIAEKNGKPGTAGGIQQKLTNFWVPGRGRYVKANVVTRQMLESFGVVFDSDGFVKSCENVPFPLP